MSLESICLAQRSMLVEEALIGPLPFFQEQMSEMGHGTKLKRPFARRLWLSTSGSTVEFSLTRSLKRIYVSR